MKQKHGKPRSYCHQAKLLKRIVGEWIEWKCAECGEHVDEDGKPYRYTTSDMHAAGPP